MKQNKYLLTGLLIVLLISSCKDSMPPDPTPVPVGTWESIGNFPAEGRQSCIVATINDKAYIGTGDQSQQDFYRYDPASDSWQPLANIPVGRSAASAFAINGKVYVVGGKASGGANLKDLWEYDPANNTWAQKADFPGGLRYDGIALALNGKGYYGTGWKDNGVGALQSQFKDWWAYDPASNQWQRRADFPGGPASLLSAVTLSDKGYVGISGPGPSPGQHWWQYDPLTDKWAQRHNFPGTARYGCGVFALADKIYVGGGTTGLGSGQAPLLDWWEYDAAGDKWSSAAPQADQRMLGVSFALGDFGYWGLGFHDFQGRLASFSRFKVE